MGVFRMDIEIARYHVEVKTHEPAAGVALVVTRSERTAAQYSVVNQTGDAWWALPIVWMNGVDQFADCFTQGGRLEAHTKLDIGWLDEACMLGPEKAGRAYFVLARVDQSSRALVQRRFVLMHELNAANIKSRWIPDAGRGPGCLCEGTEVGPQRDVLVSETVGRRTFRLRDGGHRTEQTIAPVSPGDVFPHPMPAGAKDHPDFSEW
jgi:hypothetical protein